MPFAQPAVPDRRPSPSLNVNFSSNNPFRNRAVSPASATLPSPQSPGLNINTERPVSRNPFLDVSEFQPPPPPAGSSGSTMPTTNGRTSPTKPTLTGSAAELFTNLNLNEDQPPAYVSKPPSPERRRENVPPRPTGRTPQAGHPGHRVRRSREEEDRMRAAGKSIRPSQLDIFADPPEMNKQGPRPRRNSDTSVADRSSKSLDPDALRRRRERHHRESRHADGGQRHGASKNRKPPARKLDVIDKLDVTSIYGTGLFHHDGPFDACNPHRNRKGHRTAPMSAFPKDSMNNSLGGAGPVNSSINLAQFHGRGAEGYEDYGNSAIDEYGPRRQPTNGVRSNNTFISTAKVEPVHDDESLGLGTSTFLEGAPASQKAIQRRESEVEAQMVQGGGVGGGGGGLQRKKSLAQKIRGMSNSRPSRFGDPNRTTSPENYQLERTISPTSPMSVGGATPKNEGDPFFQDYDAAYDQKGAKIAAAEMKPERNGGRVRAPSSPGRTLGLERRVTNDGSINGGGEDIFGKSGGGFLNRVKSLKGGRRTRPGPERKDTAPT